MGVFDTYTGTPAHISTYVLQIHHCEEIKVYVNIYFSNLFIVVVFN